MNTYYSLQEFIYLNQINTKEQNPSILFNCPDCVNPTNARHVLVSLEIVVARQTIPVYLKQI